VWHATDERHLAGSDRLVLAIDDPTERRPQTIATAPDHSRPLRREFSHGESEAGNQDRKTKRHGEQYAPTIRSSPCLGHADVCNMIARPLALLLLLGLSACSEDQGPVHAQRVFTEFQLALQQKQAAACRQLLTIESQQVLADMPWDAVAKKQPLEVIGAQRHPSGKNEFNIDVRDPNNDGQTAQFVVVKEYGRMVVDLIASAGRNAQVVEASASSEQFEPRQLTPADHERIREFELSQPRRSKAGGN